MVTASLCRKPNGVAHLKYHQIWPIPMAWARNKKSWYAALSNTGLNGISTLYGMCSRFFFSSFHRLLFLISFDFVTVHTHIQKKTFFLLQKRRERNMQKQFCRFESFIFVVIFKCLYSIRVNIYCHYNSIEFWQIDPLSHSAFFRSPFSGGDIWRMHRKSTKYSLWTQFRILFLFFHIFFVLFWSLKRISSHVT